MNKGKSHEGFELTINEIKMSVKMYLTIALVMLLVGFIIILFQSISDYGYLWREYFTLLWSSIRTNNREWFDRIIKYFPQMLLLSKTTAIYIALLFVPVFWITVQYFKYKAIKQRMSEYIRGAKLEPMSWVKRRMFFKSKSIPIGELKLRINDETCHVFVVGRTRSGKSQALKRVYYHLKKKGAKIFVYEAKGDYLPSYYDPKTDYILCPLDKRSVKWTLSNDLETLMDIDQVLSMGIIPDEPNSKTPFFFRAAREIFRGGIILPA